MICAECGNAVMASMSFEDGSLDVSCAECGRGCRFMAKELRIQEYEITPELLEEVLADQ